MQLFTLERDKLLEWLCCWRLVVGDWDSDPPTPPPTLLQLWLVILLGVTPTASSFSGVFLKIFVSLKESRFLWKFQRLWTKEKKSVQLFRYLEWKCDSGIISFSWLFCSISLKILFLFTFFHNNKQNIMTIFDWSDMLFFFFLIFS